MYIDPANDESPDTVTLGGDMVEAVRASIASKHFETNLFHDIMTEVRLMLTTNGLYDFLRVREISCVCALLPRV